MIIKVTCFPKILIMLSFKNLVTIRIESQNHQPQSSLPQNFLNLKKGQTVKVSHNPINISKKLLKLSSKLCGRKRAQNPYHNLSKLPSNPHLTSIPIPPKEDPHLACPDAQSNSAKVTQEATSLICYNKGEILVKISEISKKAHYQVTKEVLPDGNNITHIIPNKRVKVSVFPGAKAGALIYDKGTKSMLKQAILKGKRKEKVDKVGGLQKRLLKFIEKFYCF